MDGGVAMGVDVSLTHGLDVVVLGGRRIVWGPRNIAVDELPAAVMESRPGVIAIDGPPAWASSGKSRAIERQLMKLGISIYATPSEPAGRRFYDWMKESIAVFEAAARSGYTVYRGLRRENRHAIEVFPHATAVAILGRLPAPGERKIDFRRAALEQAGVGADAVRTRDQVDAALAALTALRFLERSSCDVGVPGESVLVMPVSTLPDRYERRGKTPRRRVALSKR